MSPTSVSRRFGRLGHSTISITGDIYSHVEQALQQEAARKADEALNRARSRRSS